MKKINIIALLTIISVLCSCSGCSNHYESTKSNEPEPQIAHTLSDYEVLLCGSSDSIYKFDCYKNIQYGSQKYKDESAPKNKSIVIQDQRINLNYQFSLYHPINDSHTEMYEDDSGTTSVSYEKNSERVITLLSPLIKTDNKENEQYYKEKAIQLIECYSDMDISQLVYSLKTTISVTNDHSIEVEKKDGFHDTFSPNQKLVCYEIGFRSDRKGYKTLENASICFYENYVSIILVSDTIDDKTANTVLNSFNSFKMDLADSIVTSIKNCNEINTNLDCDINEPTIFLSENKICIMIDAAITHSEYGTINQTFLLKPNSNN